MQQPANSLPDWAVDLPTDLNSSQLERLDIIRLHIGASNTEFRLHILSHPECTKLVQRMQYQQLQTSAPGLTKEIYFSLLLAQRLAATRLSGGDLFGLRNEIPAGLDWKDARVLERTLALVRARRWATIEDVAEAIVQDEASLPSVAPVFTLPGIEEIERQITLILREQITSG